MKEEPLSLEHATYLGRHKLVSGGARALIVYDSTRETGATSAIAECVADALRGAGISAVVCRVSAGCPDPAGYDLVVVGSPIYYERPMPSVLNYLDRHGGLVGARVAVFITCLAASRRIPGPFREVVTRRYIGQVLKHVRGEVIAVRAFKGWLRKPDQSTLKECREWGDELAEAVTR